MKLEGISHFSEVVFVRGGPSSEPTLCDSHSGMWDAFIQYRKACCIQDSRETSVDEMDKAPGFLGLYTLGGTRSSRQVTVIQIHVGERIGKGGGGDSFCPWGDLWLEG